MKKMLSLFVLCLLITDNLWAWPSETGSGVVSAQASIVRTSLEATQVLQSDLKTNLYGVTILGGVTNYTSFDSGGILSLKNVVSSRDVVQMKNDQFIQWTKSNGDKVRLGVSANDAFISPFNLSFTPDSMEFDAQTSQATIIINSAQNNDAVLRLCADNCDDLGDRWELVGEQATPNQPFVIRNFKTGSPIDTLTVYTTGSLGLLNGEFIKNLKIGEVQIGDSNSLVDEVLNVITSGNTNQSAAIRLTADKGDDPGDIWEIKHDANGNVLEFGNDFFVQGVPSQVLGLNNSGVLFMADGMQFSNYSGSNEALMAFTHDAGALRIQAAANNNAYINLEANLSTNTGDDWRITNYHTDKSLIFGNDYSGGQAGVVTFNQNGTVSASSVAVTSLFTASINTTRIMVSGNPTITSTYVAGTCHFTFNNGLLVTSTC